MCKYTVVKSKVFRVGNTKNVVPENLDEPNTYELSNNVVALEHHTESNTYEISIYNEETDTVHNLFPTFTSLSDALSKYNLISL